MKLVEIQSKVQISYNRFKIHPRSFTQYLSLHIKGHQNKNLYLSLGKQHQMYVDVSVDGTAVHYIKCYNESFYFIFSQTDHALDSLFG